MIKATNKIIKELRSPFAVECLMFDVQKLLVISFISLFPVITLAQTQDNLPSPRGAFLRSLVMPGWGHHYADHTNWNRGKYHLAGEVVLVLSYFGLDARANTLENDFYTLAQSKAGTNLSNKSRDYLIAVGNYDNLQEYNQAQLRTRNWNRVYPDSPEFRWSWESSELRNQYRDTREQVDGNRSQLPTLISLMVVNRLVSGISAFVKARDMGENLPQASFTYLNQFGQKGVTAKLRFDF
ncbi:MAG: hypothetical protein RI564_01220 [Gracilimonas sp.]|nr:hypothetical protein [Gracilimonas sp.]